VALAHKKRPSHALQTPPANSLGRAIGACLWLARMLNAASLCHTDATSRLETDGEWCSGHLLNLVTRRDKKEGAERSGALHI